MPVVRRRSEPIGRWIKRTLGRDIHTERGVDAVPVRDAAGVGEYVSKIHYEMVRCDLKTGRRKNRTPWQIALDAAETGDSRDIARYTSQLPTVPITSAPCSFSSTEPRTPNSCW